MNNNEEINKRMHEIMGLCWHTQTNRTEGYTCKECHKFVFLSEILDFTKDWSAFGIAWEFMRQHEKWRAFIIHQLHGFIGDGFRPSPTNPHIMIPDKFINPLNFSKAVIEFFKEVLNER